MNDKTRSATSSSASANDVDVLIIGAGMAGLSAALEVKRYNDAHPDRKPISFRILEATEHLGGRARTVLSKHGTPINLGANWLHGGEQNPLYPLMQQYGLEEMLPRDMGGKHITYINGERYDNDIRKWLLEGETAESIAVKRGIPAHKVRQMPITALIDDRRDEVFANYITKMWLGLDAGDIPTVGRLLDDPYEDGGIMIKGGTQRLLDAMADEIGRDHIQCNTSATSIRQKPNNAIDIEVEGGSTLHAHKVIYTGSIGAMKQWNEAKGAWAIQFPSRDDSRLRKDLKRTKMGHLAKLVLETDAAYPVRNQALINTYVDFVDQDHPMQTHLFSGGNNLITVFFAADDAKKFEAEAKSPTQLKWWKDMAISHLKQVEGLENLAGHVVDVHVTDWSRNPYTAGASVARVKEGGSRGPIRQHNLWICGEAWHPNGMGHLADAHESGVAAAQDVLHTLERAETAAGSHVDRSARNSGARTR